MATQEHEHLIKFDGHWEGFLKRFPGDEILSAMSLADLEQRLGMPAGLIKSVASAAVGTWRNSTLSSPLNGLSNFRSGIPNGIIFDNFLAQTGFIVNAMQRRLLSSQAVTDAATNGKIFAVSRDHRALTARGLEGQEAVNDLVRALAAYELRIRAMTNTGKVKLPKQFYRGVRLRDIARHEAVQVAWSKIWPVVEDLPFLYGHKLRVEAVAKIMTEIPLVELSSSPLQSFTSLQGCAARFADKDGFIVTIPNTCSGYDIVTSYRHDDGLAGYDYFTDRKEQEWILRIDPALTLVPENISISNCDYYKSINDPRCVALFNHDTTKAEYVIGGHHVATRWSWNSAGNDGMLIYWVGHEATAYSRRGVKERYGFEPLPTEKNIAQIEDFRLYECPGKYGFGVSKPLDIPGKDFGQESAGEEPVRRFG